MKTNYFLAALLAGASLPCLGQAVNGPTDAQSAAVNKDQRASFGTSATPDTNGKVHAPDGILKAQGSIHFLKAGKLTRIDNETKLSEGFVVRPNGSVTKPDGSSITLEEGQLLTLEGQMMKAPAVTGSTSPGSAATIPAHNPHRNDVGQSAVTNSKGEESK